LFRRSSNGYKLVFYDFIAAFFWALCLILLIPAVGFLTAKTKKRILSINQEGIETRIGSKEGKIPWQAVDSVVATKDRIFITGKNANTFTIPLNAFTSDDLRNKFIELATQYLGDTKNISANMK